MSGLRSNRTSARVLASGDHFASITLVRSGIATRWMQYGPGAGSVSLSLGTAAVADIVSASSDAEISVARAYFLTCPLMRDSRPRHGSVRHRAVQRGPVVRSPTRRAYAYPSRTHALRPRLRHVQHVARRLGWQQE